MSNFFRRETGGQTFGPYGGDTANAFGHVGLTNVFGWADPDRQLTVALMSSGEPIFSIDLVRLFQVIGEINTVYPKIEAGPHSRGTAPLARAIATPPP